MPTFAWHVSMAFVQVQHGSGLEVFWCGCTSLVHDRVLFLFGVLRFGAGQCLRVRSRPLHSCMSVIFVWLAFVLSSMAERLWAWSLVISAGFWVFEFLGAVGMVAGFGSEVEMQVLFDALGMGARHGVVEAPPSAGREDWRKELERGGGA